MQQGASRSSHLWAKGQLGSVCWARRSTGPWWCSLHQLSRARPPQSAQSARHLWEGLSEHRLWPGHLQSIRTKARPQCCRGHIPATQLSVYPVTNTLVLGRLLQGPGSPRPGTCPCLKQLEEEGAGFGLQGPALQWEPGLEGTLRLSDNGKELKTLEVRTAPVLARCQLASWKSWSFSCGCWEGCPRSVLGASSVLKAT